MRILHPGGMLFFEIHAGAGHAVEAVLHDQGYRDVELKQDMSGLERMVAAVRP
jgi:release factor glutamine methyltransferase